VGPYSSPCRGEDFSAGEGPFDAYKLQKSPMDGGPFFDSFTGKWTGEWRNVYICSGEHCHKTGRMHRQHPCRDPPHRQRAAGRRRAAVLRKAAPQEREWTGNAPLQTNSQMVMK